RAHSCGSWPGSSSPIRVASSARRRRPTSGISPRFPNAVRTRRCAPTSGAGGADDVYGAALESYLALGAADFDARVGQVFDDLGLPERVLDLDMRSLSGGQAARANLAAILLARFDVFLLDEPTNDLDFAGLDRLERFLRSDLAGGAAIVSHDRSFLDRTITSVLEIDEHAHTAT